MSTSVVLCLQQCQRSRQMACRNAKSSDHSAKLRHTSSVFQVLQHCRLCEVVNTAEGCRRTCTRHEVGHTKNAAVVVPCWTPVNTTLPAATAASAVHTHSLNSISFYCHQIDKDKLYGLLNSV